MPATCTWPAALCPGRSTTSSTARRTRPWWGSASSRCATSGVAALRAGGERQPVRGPDRAGLRVRGLAVRALPPPLPVPRPQRGRGGARSVRRRVPVRRGSAARRVQHALRPAVTQCVSGGGGPLPVHARRAGGPADRPARRAAGTPGGAPAGAEGLRDQHVGGVLARRRLARPHGRRGPRRRRAAGRGAPVLLRGRPSTRRARYRRRRPIPTRVAAAGIPSTWWTTRRSCAPRWSTSTAG